MKPVPCQATGFKTPRGTTGAQIIAPELLYQFLVAMHHALAAFHLALGVKIRAGAYSSSHSKTLCICVPFQPPVANLDNKKPAGRICRAGVQCGFRRGNPGLHDVPHRSPTEPPPRGRRTPAAADAEAELLARVRYANMIKILRGCFPNLGFGLPSRKLHQHP
jgi:hypothetical protein